MQDIHGNVLSVGDNVYVLTTSRPGSKYKRLFYGEIVDTTAKKCKVHCFELGRVVSVESVSLVKPYDGLGLEVDQ